MNLKKYIEKVGDVEAGRIFKVATRTAASWRRGERFPRKEQADFIVANSPVTYDGIYNSERRAAA